MNYAARRLVYQENKLKLYCYEPTQPQTSKIPLLIVYALVNRPDVLDLHPETSFIRGLLAQGLPVYLIDWGYPTLEDKNITLNDYILGLLHRCVLKVREHSVVEKINLLGVCQGGVFSLCYSALRADYINKLITLVTPVDFHTQDNILSRIVRHIDINAWVDTLGNIPGALLNQLLLMLKLNRWLNPTWLELLQNPYDSTRYQQYHLMEKWLYDTPDLAGETFRQFATALYQQNQLIKGELMIGQERVDLKQLSMPLLNIYAHYDYLVPPSSSQALEHHVGSKNYTAFSLPTGHIGLFTSKKARQLPFEIARWYSH